MRVYFKTYGCSLNQSDSEVMAGLLAEAGFMITTDPERADIVIVNSCVVKGPTEQKVLRYIQDLKHKYVVITGCMPQTMPEKLKGYSMLGPTHITDIVEAVEETVNGNSYVSLTFEDAERLNLPHVRTNKIVEIIPVSRGCLGSCSYCIVNKARGKLKSYPKEDILRQFRKSIYTGAREVWLTSQDMGAYGRDIGLTLPELLKEMVQQDGDYRIRVGMMNPDHLKDFIDGLLPLFESRKLFRFMHIPVQSGNDKVLKDMGRKYSAEDFRELCSRIRKAYPEMAIATDVICGFPGETEEQFNETIELMKKIAPDVVNISRYWDRPGTTSSGMDGKLGLTEIKDRSGKMASAVEWIQYERNKRWRDWAGSVIVEKKGQGSSWIARNYCYKNIIVNGDLHPGQTLRVKVIKTASNDLYGAAL